MTSPSKVTKRRKEKSNNGVAEKPEKQTVPDDNKNGKGKETKKL